MALPYLRAGTGCVRIGDELVSFVLVPEAVPGTEALVVLHGGEVAVRRVTDEVSKFHPGTMNFEEPVREGSPYMRSFPQAAFIGEVIGRVPVKTTGFPISAEQARAETALWNNGPHLRERVRETVAAAMREGASDVTMTCTDAPREEFSALMLDLREAGFVCEMHPERERKREKGDPVSTRVFTVSWHEPQ